LREPGAFAHRSFSARFDDDPTICEGQYMDLAARHAGVDATAVTPTPAGFLDEVHELHWHQEEPFLSASVYAQWCVMRLARRHGIQVLIDGQGADELLGGYACWFRDFQLDELTQGRVANLVWNSWAFRRRLRVAARSYADSQRRFDSQAALGWRSLAQAAQSPPPRMTIDWGPGLPSIKPGNRLRRAMAEAFQYSVLPSLLRYCDRNAMAFGVEARLPFLDRRLIEMCIAFPPQALIRHGWQKYLLRRAGEGLLPKAIQWRADKVGYAAPMDAWLRGPLAEWAQSLLFSGPITELPDYDSPAIAAAFATHRAGAANQSWLLWKWLSLSQWLYMVESGAFRRPATTASGACDSRSDALVHA
jgi:asparagine synthase (glutamine-hydrolysing)